MDGAVGWASRTRTNTGSRNTGGRRRLVRTGDAIVEESARRVRQHIKASLGKPVIVPVPLVGTVAGVAHRLPLVFVVAKPVQQDDQRVAVAGVRLGQREIDIEQRFIPAGNLAGADADAAVSRAVAQGRNRRFRLRGNRRRRRAEHQQRGWHNGAPANGSPSVRVAETGFGSSVVRPRDPRQAREIRWSSKAGRSPLLALPGRLALL